MMVSATHPAATRFFSDARLIAADVVDLMYAQATSSIVATSLCGLALMVILETPFNHLELLIWFLVLVLTQVIRIRHIAALPLRRIQPDWDAQEELRHFCMGVLVSTLAWIVFPPLFLPGVDVLSRSAVAIVYAGMAGGSLAIFSPVRWLEIFYCCAMLLPLSLVYLLEGGHTNYTLALLACSYLGALIVASGVIHHSILGSIRLNRLNQVLLDEMQQEKRRTEHANEGLLAAKQALIEGNLLLATRVRERTAELEREVAAKEHYARELTELAARDPLTRLLNRPTFTARLGECLAKATQSGSRVAVLFIDLDHFKEVNDVQGHFAGDKVLGIVAGLLQNNLPANAELARWGGDEFVAVIDGVTHSDEILELGQELRQALCEPIDIGYEYVRIDATMGIALFPEHGDTPDELIRAADVAMYAAKASGHADVRLFNPALGERLRERHTLAQTLRAAVSAQQLTLAFQPIVDGIGGRCVAMEALLRWSPPEHGPVSPSDFIPLAENSGAILPLGRWVMIEACLAAMGWHAGANGNQPPAVSVNVSVAQLLSADMIGDVAHALHLSGLPPHRLHVEVTESLFAADHERVVPVLRWLRQQGIRISIDDFGTGFSSLSYLQTLPVDIIKIDRSFVQDADRGARAIVEAILSIARAMQFKVVAEGVETIAQQQLLQSLGTHYFQGFLFARPMHGDTVSAWLASRNWPE